MTEKQKNFVTQVRFKNGTLSSKAFEDEIAVESPLTLFLNKKELVTILCTPKHLEEMVIGYLFNEHFIMKIDEIKSIYLDTKKNSASVEIERDDTLGELRYRRFLSSDCTNPVSFRSLADAAMVKPVKSNLKLSIERIKYLLNEMGKHALLYRSTGCTHSASICSSQSIIFLAEDIGRHNAVDKVIGFCLKNRLKLSDKILITSGRITSGITLKSINAGIPIIVSRAAPTSYSLQLGKDYGVTLIGFMRGNKANVYTHQNRIEELS